MVRVWDTNTGKELTTLTGHAASIDEVTFSPDGRRIASCSVDRTIKIWDLEVDKEGTVLKGHGARVWELAFSPDGRRLVSASADKTVKVWDVSEAKEITTLSGHEGLVWSVAISPDGTRIVSGGFISARLWDLATGDELMTLPAVTSNGALGVAFSPDGRTIAGACDKDVILWQSAPR